VLNKVSHVTPQNVLHLLKVVEVIFQTSQEQKLCDQRPCVCHDISQNNMYYLADIVTYIRVDTRTDVHYDGITTLIHHKSILSIHGGRVANALACNAGCHGFALQLRRHF